VSEHIGAKLPPPLRFELGNIEQYQHANAALLISVDEDGFPRVAVVPASAVAAPDERTLHVSLHAGSTTSKNLRARGQAVLWSVLDAAAYSVRASVKPRELAHDDPAWHTYELQVVAVLRDFQPDAPLVSGPAYKRL
jgi:hypothetical protein